MPDVPQPVQSGLPNAEHLREVHPTERERLTHLGAWLAGPPLIVFTPYALNEADRKLLDFAREIVERRQ